MSIFSVRYADLSGLPPATGLYIVFCGATCLYVGSSKNVRQRIAKHNRRSEFEAHKATHVEFIPVPLDKLAGEENAAVKKLRPKLNVYAARSSTRKAAATAQHSSGNSKLRDVTLQLLNSRRRTLTLAKIAEDTGLGLGFVSTFSAGKTPNPGVCGVEKLYEYLSGKSLDV